MVQHDNLLTGPATSRLLAILVLLVCALSVPLITYSLIDHPPEYDELLHVLAARGVLETGEPVIENGFYYRAEIYTRLIARTLQLPFDELVAARLPALVFAMMLAGLLGYWTTRRAGWLAGLTAALVFTIVPPTINLTVIVRFYTLHALLITLMMFLVYDAGRTSAHYPRLLASLVLLAALAWLAFQLHDITMISLGALACGVLFLIAWRYRANWLPAVMSHPGLSIILGFVTLGIGFYLAWKLGVIDLLRQSRPAWSETRSNDFAFYLGSLGSQMPFIWPLFPVMAVAACWRYRQLAGYLLVIVVVAFTANSIASQKATRYLYHIFPLICVIWGLGFQVLVQTLSTAIRRRTGLSPVLSTTLVLALAFACVISTQEFRRTAKLLLGRPLVNDAVHLSEEPDWLAARPIIDPLLPDTERVIASSGFKSLFAFDRYAYELHTTVVAETDTGQEFGTDPRSGRQVIGTAASTREVIDMPGTELFILERQMLNTPYGVNPDTVELIGELCTSIPVPEHSGLAVWRCP